MELHQLRHFELRDLCYFVAVAEELHFARAAERVGIHQSPLSKAISLMERQLGVRLFARDRRSTQLTMIGEMLLSDARRILMAANQAHLGILAAAAGRTGRLRVAIADGLAHPRLAALLRRTHVEDSRVDVQITRYPPSEQLRLLRSGLLDVGLTATAPDLHALVSAEHSQGWSLHGLGEDIHAVPIWRDTLSVALERNHAMASEVEIDWDALASAQLIVSGERSPTCGLAGTLVDLSGYPRRLQYVASMELLLTLVAAGKGVGLIGTGLATTIHRDDLAFRPLRTRRAKVATLLLRRRDDESPLVARFVERAQKIA